MTVADLCPALPPYANGKASPHTSHAHPYPKTHNHISQHYIQELLTNADVNVVLTGLPGANKARVTDVYCPEVRRSTPTDKQHVNHLDVVSCWKGLSFHQASEIALWETIFRDCLENQLRDTVSGVIAEHLSSISFRNLPPHELLNQSSATSYFKDFVSAKNPRLIGIDISKLVYDMIEKYHEEESNFEYSWFKCSGNLPATVYNFLRTRDCFLDTFPYPSLEVSFHYEQSLSGFYIFGDADWHPPNLNFPNLPIKLHCGAEYRIFPQYLEPDLGSKYGARFSKFDVEPEYTVTSTKMPVAWDSDLRCFRSIVPPMKQQDFLVEHVNESTNTTKTTETKFSAKLVMHFPSNVRFEQITRYSIKLEIGPLALKSSVPTRDVEPKDVKSAPEEAFHLHVSPRPEESASVNPESRLVTPQLDVGSWLPSYTNTPLSKCRRDSVQGTVSGDSSDDEKCSSVNTSSVERRADRLIPYFGLVAQSRKFSPWSCGNFTDEVASQVDVLNQNHSPGQDAAEKANTVLRDVGYDGDYDSMEPLLPNRVVSPRNGHDSHDDILDEDFSDAIHRGDWGSTYLADQRSPVYWEECTNDGASPPASFEKELVKTTGEHIVTKAVRRESIGRKFIEKLEEDHGFKSFHKRPCYPNNMGKSLETIGFCDGYWEDSDNLAQNHRTLPQKRKATKQIPNRKVLFRTPSAFYSGSLALDKFEHLDLELVAKRQRLTEGVGLGVHMRDIANNCIDDPEEDEYWNREFLPGLAATTTGLLGEAVRIPSPPPNFQGWFQKLKLGSERMERSIGNMPATRSRAYEANLGGSKVIPALKKKGSVKRMVFRRKRSVLNDGRPSFSDNGSVPSISSPVGGEARDIERLVAPHMEDSSWSPRDCTRLSLHYLSQGQDEANATGHNLDQHEIIKTYLHFLNEKQSREDATIGSIAPASSSKLGEHHTNDDEDCKVFEKIFLDDSQAEDVSFGGSTGSDWNTDQEKNLSMDLETMSLAGITNGDEKEVA